ncbi:MAG: hypothetical protein ACKPKO_43715 [Candidatus Fonsibacter sp.]
MEIETFRLALPSMNPDVSVTSPRQLQFGSDFIVIVIDAHNGLQMKDAVYTGLEYRSPAGRTMFDEYNSFMDELRSFFPGRLRILALLRTVRHESET